MPLDKIDDLKALQEAGKIPDPPVDTSKRRNVETSKRQNRTASLHPSSSILHPSKDGKVDIAAMGPPPPGFAWTRTGREVVETWPEEPLTCPDCGGEVTLKSGRFGPYFGCSAYPRCSFVANLRGEAKKRAEIESPRPVRPKPIPTDIPCDECGEPMVIRTGRSGPFLGCSKYPRCRNSKPLPEGETVETLATSGK